MRTGGCTVQQTLTPEAATVVKQAMALARRRGHAQVTPLHVANTMLASPTGLLRRACLQSHSHPLQCKALELCFNVALNRLPASSSSPMFGPQSQSPSISNALVAAFKRAQAHQRRGSIENQQQPILAVKIELEQLIISILDDPSVSRVMREAGFSSIQVKSNVEQAVSLELQSSPSNPKEKNTNTTCSLFLSQSSPSSPQTKVIPSSLILAKHEDVMSVVNSMMNRKRRSIVVVGECLPSLEAVVKGVREKVDNGDVGEPLKQLKFITVPLSAFANNRREEVEQKIGELTCLVKSLVSKGVVLYLGDLKWITDYKASSSSSGSHSRIGCYCSVEHMIMEIGRLICSFGEHGMLWLLGIATFQTFMRCKTGHHSLESVWGLHPTTVPAGSLGLSLNPADNESDPIAEHRNKKSENGSSWMVLENGDDDNNEEKQLNCCADCSAKFEVEALSLQKTNSMSESTLSSLPPWLRDESRRLHSSTHDQKCVSVKELCKKWNSICSSEHKPLLERNLTFPPPSSSSSFFSYDQQYPSLRMYIPENMNPARTAFWVNPNSNSTPASSSEIMETEYYVPKFKELSAENLNILCNALEEKVPWQKDIIAEIAGTVLQCRSGMVRRREKSRNGGHDDVKEETWLFFKGGDVQAKEKIARELAKTVFGSPSKLVSIALSSFSSSAEDLFRHKRTRDEQSCSYIERFSQAVSANPHRVFMVEDVEQVDYCSQLQLKRAIQTGKISSSFNGGEDVSFRDAIIILSCESFTSRSRACSPPVKQKSSSDNLSSENALSGGEETTSSCGFLDLNISINDDHERSVEEDDGVDNLGLVESVDSCVTFKIQNHHEEEDIIFV
ncbi:PREDICTED: protein SMAX1-LIKE 3 [Ipomoea nil]|uniref:protein SMAX1-LIKE 3 n=1 Tax=Ipomoea nil TaxID=35883 RepID=UPI00090135AB|nr:PREDICTED: protein SMAX1-LIKE 3 [Ipomoea nil]